MRIDIPMPDLSCNLSKRSKDIPIKYFSNSNIYV